MIRVQRKNSNEKFRILLDTESIYYALMDEYGIEHKDDKSLDIVVCGGSEIETIKNLSLMKNQDTFVVIDSISPEIPEKTEIKYENKVHLNEGEYSLKEVNDILNNMIETKNNDIRACSNSLLSYKIKNISDIYTNKQKAFIKKKEAIVDILNNGELYYSHKQVSIRLLLEHMTSDGINSLSEYLNSGKRFFISTVKNLNDLSSEHIYDLIQNSTEPSYLEPVSKISVEKYIEDGRTLYLHENVVRDTSVKPYRINVGRLNKQSNKRLRSLIFYFYKENGVNKFNVYKPDVKKAPY